jgi:hypothetical protein
MEILNLIEEGSDEVPSRQKNKGIYPAMPGGVGG